MEKTNLSQFSEEKANQPYTIFDDDNNVLQNPDIVEGIEEEQWQHQAGLNRREETGLEVSSPGNRKSQSLERVLQEQIHSFFDLLNRMEISQEQAFTLFREAIKIQRLALKEPILVKDQKQQGTCDAHAVTLSPGKNLNPKTNTSLPLTILVLEMNARMRVHLENKFQKKGFNVTMLTSLEELFEILNRSTGREFKVLVADTAFFFTEGGREDPHGKTVLDKIEADYMNVPLILTSTLPLTMIRTKLLQKGIPYLLHKPDLSNLDLSEVQIQFTVFFNELQSNVSMIHSKYSAFYHMVKEWFSKDLEVCSQFLLSDQNANQESKIMEGKL